ncbi:MAG: hypothetical protein ABSH14_03880 [Verrucomicrobiia bacterium]|jgi:hypothetical protein
MEKRSLLVVCPILRTALWTSAPAQPMITNVARFGAAFDQPVLSFPLALPGMVTIQYAQSKA